MTDDEVMRGALDYSAPREKMPAMLAHSNLTLTMMGVKGRLLFETQLTTALLREWAHRLEPIARRLEAASQGSHAGFVFVAGDKPQVAAGMGLSSGSVETVYLPVPTRIAMCHGTLYDAETFAMNHNAIGMDCDVRQTFQRIDAFLARNGAHDPMLTVNLLADGRDMVLRFALFDMMAHNEPFEFRRKDVLKAKGAGA